LANDPVGKFVSSDGGAYRKAHVRFDRLDAHDVIANGIETLAITPKLSDGHIQASAVALCTRTVDGSGAPTSQLTCRGI
jgi:hypothetical protein